MLCSLFQIYVLNMEQDGRCDMLLEHLFWYKY